MLTSSIKHISSFGHIAQWLERVHGKHEVLGSNPTRANFLYGIEKPFHFLTSNFYGLPRVHKCKIIQEAVKVRNSEYIKIYDLTLQSIVAV